MSRHESNKLIEEARLLLPWYLTDTLSEEEQDLVNRALECSEDLRKEFVREEQMMHLVKDNTSLLELSALETTEQRLANTLARIEREEQANKKEDRVAVKKKKQPVQILRQWFGQFFGKKLFDTNWLTPANASFAALLAVQVGLLAFGTERDSTSTVYQSASVPKAGDSSFATNSVKAVFLMEFQSDAQHGAVCDFLNTWNARIVSGPNSHNMFTVEMLTDSQTDAVALADNVMAEASQKNLPVIFIGPQFRE